MTEVAPDQLKQAVESQHGGTATFIQAVPIREMHGEQLAWQGTVHIFDLEGHPSSNRAYAWSYELADGKRRMFAVLHTGPITGPREAVRAAIVAEVRAGR
jgi:hypothetical protein